MARITIVVVCFALLCALPTRGRAQDEKPTSPGEFVDHFEQDDEEEQDVIKYKDGRLTTDVVDLSLRELLTEIGKQSGAKVRLEGEDRTVTDRFTALPLDQAVRRLASNRNFSIVYADGARLKEIHVFAVSKAKDSANRPVVRPAPKPVTTQVQNEKSEIERAEEAEVVEEVEDEEQDFRNPVASALLGRDRDEDKVPDTWYDSVDDVFYDEVDNDEPYDDDEW